jgi:VWFA-related protein
VSPRLLPAVAMFAAAGAVADLTAQQQPFFETFEVRLHNLDVLVTDASGNPVRGLTKEDFIVLENGVEQNVTNFSMYDSGTWSAGLSARQEKRQAESLSLHEQKAPPRRVVFFVDDMAVRKPARKTLIQHATALVDQLGPGDLATVIRPTGSKRIAQPYTNDKAAVQDALTAAIESCTLRFDSPGQAEIEQLLRALASADNAMDRKYARSLYRQQAEERVQQRLSQLRALVGSLAAVDGRKILVVITSGITAHPGRDVIDPDDQIGMGIDRVAAEWGEGGDFTPLIDELARTAAANGVTIYALEPELPLDVFVRNVTTGSRTTGSTRTDAHVRAQTIAPTQMFEELNHYRGLTLTSLAERTGGKWFRGTAVIDDVFRQVASDLRLYYSLAYRANGAYDKPRRVQVKVRNRPELNVRTRTEVIDRSPEREMGDQVTAALLFPRELNELRIDVTAGRPARDGGRFTVPLDVVIPLDELTFVRGESDRYVATFDVHFAAAGDQSDFTTSGKQRQTVEITAPQHASRAGTTYRFKTGIVVPRGGSKISIGVMDQASRLVGFERVEVEAR